MNDTIKLRNAILGGFRKKDVLDSIEMLVSQLSHSENELKNKTSQYLEEKQAYTNKITEYEKQIAKLEASLIESEQKNESAAESIAVLQNENQRLQNELEQRGDFTELSDKIKQLEAENQQLQKEIENKEREIVSLKSSKEELYKENTNLKNQIEQISKNYEFNSSAEKQALLQQLRQENELLKQQLQEKTAAGETSAQLISSLRQKIDQLTVQLNQKENASDDSDNLDSAAKIGNIIMSVHKNCNSIIEDAKAEAEKITSDAIEKVRQAENEFLQYKTNFSDIKRQIDMYITALSENLNKIDDTLNATEQQFSAATNNERKPKYDFPNPAKYIDKYFSNL